MMRNLSESDARTVRLGGIAVALIVVFMIGSFAFDYWAGLDKQVRDADRKLSDIANGLTAAGQATKAMEQVREKSTVYTSFPGLNQQTARMREQVETLPGYSALAVARLEDLPLREDEPLYKSSVALQFSGTLGGLHQFLGSLEKAKPALRVERLNLSTQQKNASRVEGQMTITGYGVVLGKGSQG